MDGFLDGLWIVRLIFQRGLAAIYLIAFVCALHQFRPLLGERGLLPVPSFVARVRFVRAPSLFHFHYSDRFFACIAVTGIGLAVVALLGLPDVAPWWVGTAAWLALFTLYLSIVNVGQTFYGFGWESMLLEAGFLAAFLGPSRLEPSAVAVLLLRWMLFRVELGAGLIKLRHDRCWRDLTCLFYHHETQPMPNAIAWYAHRLPRPMLAGGVVFSHFVQIICPFGLFAPQPIASIAGACIIVHQLLLIAAGNYAWLNWLTVVLAVTAFGDAELGLLVPISAPSLEPRPLAFDVVIAAVAVITAILSVKPTQNFFSRRQAMNASYNPLHLVNAYGAFGAVTRERYEIILEGTTDAHPTDRTVWKVFQFKGKPGDPKRRPPQVAPYHLRLDWLMWFVPLSIMRGGRLSSRGVDVWFLRLIAKLLVGDHDITSLLRHNPFQDAPPRFVRAHVYRYRYTDPAERKATGAWWKASFAGELLPPIGLAGAPFDARSEPALEAMTWVHANR
jgi:hypothetical protein